jgi:hypothetical protein
MKGQKEKTSGNGWDDTWRWIRHCNLGGECTIK